VLFNPRTTSEQLAEEHQLQLRRGRAIHPRTKSEQLAEEQQLGNWMKNNS
jgi:hypothetical protein